MARKPGETRGRKTTFFSKSECKAFLAEVEKGVGRMRALANLNLSYKTLRRTIVANEAFAEGLKVREDAIGDDCARELYEMRQHPMVFARIAACTGILNQMDKTRKYRAALALRRQQKVDGAKVDSLVREMADAAYDLVPEAKRDELIRRVESIRGRLATETGGKREDDES